MIPRAQMLAELMRFRQGIAVAGSHGKTTTTSLVASLLAAGGLDPTYVIGGRVNELPGRTRGLGAGEYLVAEADESDGSFLLLNPVMAVVTNIDNDHLGAWGGDFERLKDGFVDFVQRLPFYGLVVACADDAVLRALFGRFGRPLLTYGIEWPAEVRAVDLASAGGRSRFTAVFADGLRLPVELNLPGRHNVLNALAALAVAHELGVAPEAMQQALAGFAGIGRRFQRLGSLPLPGGAVELVDDYAHHPRELRATLAAARETWPDRRLVVLFQPHRYSRTRDLLDDFAAELCAADVLLLSEVYPAGERPLPGADGRALSQAVRARGKVDPVFVAELNEAPAVLRDLLRPGDVLLTLGAGSIGAFAAALPARWAEEGGA
ncbi:MAG: UDP-N-acetylmuramate--L-alanine ligase [Gammaproteobacteria bacterium]|nr:MAG: UDP-N-acetylmuramate--L-alanine ligase [Gammaproteobacteria bacterium]